MDDAAGEMSALLQRYYPLLVARAWADAEADLGRAIPFDAAGADAITAEIGARAAGITATLQDRIARLVNTTAEDPAALDAGLRALGLDAAKAAEIAVTEVGTVYNRGIALASVAAGLADVYVTDGDRDPICAAVHGTYQTVAWAAAHPSGHPRCTRRFAIAPVGRPAGKEIP